MQRHAQKGSTSSKKLRARDRGIEDGPRLRFLGGCFSDEGRIIVLWGSTGNDSPYPYVPAVRWRLYSGAVRGILSGEPTR